MSDDQATEFYEITFRRIEPPKPGVFHIVTAAVWSCGLCGVAISGNGGPGNGELCMSCGDALKRGVLRGAVVWMKED